MNVLPRSPSRLDWTPRQSGRLVAAFAIQPFAAGLIAFTTFPLLYFTDLRLRGPTYPWDGAQSVAAAAGLVGIPVAAVAVGVFALLSSSGPVTMRHAVAAGAILGNLPILWVLGLMMANGSARETAAVMSVQGFAILIRALAYGSLVGTGCAVVFWAIAGRHLRYRPDVSQENP